MTSSVSSTTGAAAVFAAARGEDRNFLGWINVVVAAVIMLATLPGRTQGLGLITEPLLADLRLDRVTYANVNLWATLIGAIICLPIGRLLDRAGLRWTTVTIVLLLGVVVWQMSVLAGGVAALFALVLATRALGQSALSVSSITIVGKSFDRQVGVAMGVYSVLLSVMFAAAFVYIGGVVLDRGWRVAWLQVALALVMFVAPLALISLREPQAVRGERPASTETGEAPRWRGATTENIGQYLKEEQRGQRGCIAGRMPRDDHHGLQRRSRSLVAEPTEPGGLSLSEALRTPAFWIFGGATALFGLVSSGLGLFNEAVLAERGFSAATFHTFLAVTAVIALAGQLTCGWLSTRWSMQRLLAVAMVIYAIALGALPLVVSLPQLWLFAVLMGFSGGMITVIFFAVWRTFGSAHLGRIQGAAQMLTVVASAVGPLIFAKCAAWTGSYAPALWTLAPCVLIVGAAALKVVLPADGVRPTGARH